MLHAAAAIHLDDAALRGSLLGGRALNRLLALIAGDLIDHRAADDCYRGKRCDGAGQKKFLHYGFLDWKLSITKPATIADLRAAIRIWATAAIHWVCPSFLLLV